MRKKERNERFMNEPTTPIFDNKAYWKREKKKEIGTVVDDIKALLGSSL